MAEPVQLKLAEFSAPEEAKKTGKGTHRPCSPPPLEHYNPIVHGKVSVEVRNMCQKTIFDLLLALISKGDQ